MERFAIQRPVVQLAVDFQTPSKNSLILLSRMHNVATPAPLYLRSSWRSTSHIIIIIFIIIIIAPVWL